MENVGKLIIFFGMQGSKIQIVFIYAHLSYLVRQERCVIFSLKYVFIFENNEPLALTLLNRWLGQNRLKIEHCRLLDVSKISCLGKSNQLVLFCKM